MRVFLIVSVFWSRAVLSVEVLVVLRILRNVREVFNFWALGDLRARLASRILLFLRIFRTLLHLDSRRELLGPRGLLLIRVLVFCLR